MQLREFGPALKCFHQIEQHFSDIYDDQFDFHAYGLRKMTLRSYVDMLRCHDRLRSHPFFVKAATDAVLAYLDYYDNPPSFFPSESELGTIVNTAAMTDAERKKALKKARKAEQKQQEAAALASKEVQLQGKNSKKKVDLDPLGNKYIENIKPLDDVIKFLRPLNTLSPDYLEGWLLACQVYQRKSILSN
jgi:peptide alpha-N-acetyltransferase